MNKLKQLFATIRHNLLEYYTLALLTVGVPLVAFIYLGWKAAVLSFVLVQSTLGILAIVRGNV